MIALSVMLLGALGGAIGLYGCYRQWQRQMAAKRDPRLEPVAGDVLIQGNRVVRRVTE